MKKKKNQGCIYWDESSRGTKYDRPRGRWVGERLENGKRVRMRSTDYEKVLRWVQELPVRKRDKYSESIPLKGMPQYSVDMERKAVYGKNGKTLKGVVRGSRIVYHLVHNKVRHFVSFNRIAYAALHDIEVLKIPTDLIVTECGGEYILQYAGDFQVIHNKSLRHKRMANINNILSKRMRELDMLQRYYKTGNSAEIVTYATKDIFGTLLTMVMKRNHCGIERATDIVTEATEQFLHRLTTGDLPTISISATIQGLCHRCVRNGARKRVYNDEVRYKSPL